MNETHVTSTSAQVLCYLSATEKDESYAKIAQEIAHLEESLIAMKERHNSLNITQRLPPEVLAQVFEWNAVMETENDPHSRERSWIDVTHVCARWRRVALAWPSLWSRVPIQVSSCRLPISEIFSRARSLPLSINIERDNGNKDVGFVFSQIHRVRVLCIRPLSVCQDFFRESRHAPFLEELRIDLSWPMYDYRPRRIGIAFPPNAPRLRLLEFNNCIVPWESQIFSGATTLLLKENTPSQIALLPIASTTANNFSALQKLEEVRIDLPRAKHSTIIDMLAYAPRLRLLELKRCVIPWGSPIPTHLTTFILRDVPVVPTLAHLIAVLCRLPNLQHLTLRELNGGIVEAGAWELQATLMLSDPTSQFPVANLPHLQHLEIMEDLGNCTILLPHLAYPRTTTIDVTAFTAPIASEVDFEIQLTRLTRLGALLSGGREDIRRLSLVNSSKELCLKTWTKTVRNLLPPQDEPFTTVSLRGRLHDYGQLSPPENGRMLHALWQNMSLTILEVLHTFNVLVDSCTWRKSFGDIPTLETVITSGYLWTFMKALDPSDNYIQCGDTTLTSLGEQPWFYSLRHLMLVPNSTEDVDVETLQRCLRERHELGSPLHELYLGKNNVDG